MLRHVLLTYSMYNFDVGYVQGFSDLASPILFVVRGECAAADPLAPPDQLAVEAEAFWAFAALMERLEGCFSSDGNGMEAQLVALRRLLA